MRKLASLILLAVALSVSALTTLSQTSVAEQLIKAAAPDRNIDWSKTIIRFDADGDGIEDFTWLGQSKSKVRIGFVHGPLQAKSKVQLLEFGVGGVSQSDLCALPATLRLERLDYTPGSRDIPPLHGFRRSRALRGLVLHGGDCDDIHLYWNRASHLLAWWRR